MTEYRMTITDDAAASLAASILDRKRHQVEVIHGVMKDMTYLGESLRAATVTPRDTWNALDKMFESLQDLVFDLSKEAS